MVEIDLGSELGLACCFWRSAGIVACWLESLDGGPWWRQSLVGGRQCIESGGVCVQPDPELQVLGVVRNVDEIVHEILKCTWLLMLESDVSVEVEWFTYRQGLVL